MIQATTQAPARPRPRARQKTPEEESPAEDDDTNDETASVDDEVPGDAEIIIPHLHVSKDPIVMTTTHDNETVEKTYGNQSIQAYAKICGRKWTYYCQEPTINIGREQAQENSDETPPVVHIDLGPSKVVSRTHAVITYGPHDELWYIHVNGRNGVKIDDEDVRKGQTQKIHCGSVIAIAGTEMLFQVPEQKDQIHQKYKDRVVREEEELDNAGLNDSIGSHHPQTYFSMPMAPPSGGAQYSPYPPVGSTYQPQPNVVPSPNGPVRPITPTTSPTKQVGVGSAKKRSPPNRRGINGIMMESTEQIDYSLDSSKEIKPACSYAAMITWAITSTPDETLALADIYEWIKKHFAYYRYAATGWQV